MKKTLVLIFLFYCAFVQAATYYIDPDGDDSGFGSKQFPWKTLSKATEVARFPKDTIHVNPGTYTETNECELAEGVSIVGEGDQSIINAQISGDWAYVLRLHSDFEGTKGNQVISNIQFNGGNLTYGAIHINARSNVVIHDCNFTDFIHSGVTFNGKVEAYDPVRPTTYATGNKFYNNTMTNCSEFVFNSYGAGCLQIGGQDGMLIYNNTIIQDSRPDGYNGYCIKYNNDGFNRGVKIYNNTLVRESPTEYSWDWNFAIELWNSDGGIEIYDNTIFGSVDIVHGIRGNYDYTLSVHDNIIGYTSLRENSSSANNGGIFIERDVDGVLVYSNVFRNIGSPIQLYPSGGELVKDIYIQYNLFDGVGILSEGNHEALINWASSDGQHTVIIENFNFINNTVYVGEGGASTGIRLPNIGAANNVNIRNNIIYGFVDHSIISDLNGETSINNLSVENNILYENGNNSYYAYGNTPTNVVDQNNIIANPDFWSTTNFRVKKGSPAIDAGITIPGLLYDLEGVEVQSPPNIGCYETLASSATPKYYSSVIENDAPSVIEVEYDIALDDASIPDTTAFYVTVNSTPQKLNSVNVDGGIALVSLDEPVGYNSIVTISYTAPSQNPLQSVTNVVAEGFVNQLVICNVKNISSSDILIYPNPTNNELFISIPDKKISFPFQLKIYSNTGKLHYNEPVYSLEYPISISNVLTPGLYFAQFISSGKVLANQKLIVVD